MPVRARPGSDKSLHRGRRIPPSFFSICFGLAGLAGGYAILAVVQLRRVPMYARLRFSPGF
jgi:hypothetical protein